MLRRRRRNQSQQPPASADAVDLGFAIRNQSQQPGAVGEAVDLGISRVAARQKNLITTRQLRQLGLSKAGIARRVKNGRLHPVHRGVFVVGTALLLPRARELAAVLACGPRAALSHLSGSVVLGLRDDAGRDVDVTVPGQAPKPRDGIRPHRSVCLAPGDVGTYDGIPITSPARTLLDIAPLISRNDLGWAYNEALIQALVTPEQIRDLLARTHGHPGSRSLRAVVERDVGPRRTAGELERRVLDALRRGGVPGPLTGERVAGWSVDFYWPQYDLVLEADGYKFHHGPQSWRRDRRKQADLENHGLRVLRTDWDEVTERPESMVARVVRAQLERGGTVTSAAS